MPEKKKDAKKAAAKAAKKFTGPVNLVLVLDESGSMGGNEEAVVGGANEFVEQFKDHDAKVTLTMFDTGNPRVRVKHDREAIKKVKPLVRSDYNPRGGTPLNDAIIETVELVKAKAKKGERGFVVILTDGMENASQHSAGDVERVVKACEKQGWAFLYLGANHDAHGAASKLGMGKQGQSFMFTSSAKGTRSALRASTGFAQNYFGSANLADYDSKSADVFASTGGTIDEDADEAEKKIRKITS